MGLNEPLTVPAVVIRRLKGMWVCCHNINIVVYLLLRVALM
jgi:hypothetical protein